MKKPTPDKQEIRNLKAAISVWKNRYARLEKECEKQNRIIELQHQQITRADDRFDALLRLKGEK